MYTRMGVDIRDKRDGEYAPQPEHVVKNGACPDQPTNMQLHV
jgi:hypothetical protein